MTETLWTRLKPHDPEADDTLVLSSRHCSAFTPTTRSFSARLSSRAFCIRHLVTPSCLALSDKYLIIFTAFLAPVSVPPRASATCVKWDLCLRAARGGSNSPLSSLSAASESMQPASSGACNGPGRELGPAALRNFRCSLLFHRQVVATSSPPIYSRRFPR